MPATPPAKSPVQKPTLFLGTPHGIASHPPSGVQLVERAYAPPSTPIVQQASVERPPLPVTYSSRLPAFELSSHLLPSVLRIATPLSGEAFVEILNKMTDISTQWMNAFLFHPGSTSGPSVAFVSTEKRSRMQPRDQ